VATKSANTLQAYCMQYITLQCNIILEIFNEHHLPRGSSWGTFINSHGSAAAVGRVRNEQKKLIHKPFAHTPKSSRWRMTMVIRDIHYGNSGYSRVVQWYY
jgi:hypothetical protein